jgi:hypothetical protein
VAEVAVYCEGLTDRQTDRINLHVGLAATQEHVAHSYIQQPVSGFTVGGSDRGCECRFHGWQCHHPATTSSGCDRCPLDHFRPVCDGHRNGSRGVDTPHAGARTCESARWPQWLSVSSAAAAAGGQAARGDY